MTEITANELNIILFADYLVLEACRIDNLHISVWSCRNNNFCENENANKPKYTNIRNAQLSTSAYD